MRICGILGLVLLPALSLVCRADTVEIAATSGSVSFPFQIVGDAIVQTNDTPLEHGGKAVYRFTITNSTDYVIWADVAGRPNTQCTIKICFDEESADSKYVWQFEGSDTVKRRTVGSKKNVVSHRNYTVFPLKAGTHELLVRAATGGVKIEKFYIRPHHSPSPPSAPQFVKDRGITR